MAKRKRKSRSTTPQKGKRKAGKMPPKVLAYFKYRNEGMSKQAAKKKAGL